MNESQAALLDPSRGLYTVMSPDALADLIRRRGFRAEEVSDHNGAPMIKSASSGVQFHVRFGNRAADGESLFFDFAYVCLVQLEGSAALELVATWNAGKRFARLHAHDRLLVLEMDVLVAGGVTEGYLLTGLEIWDRLIQELVVSLRATAQGTASAAGAQPAGTATPRPS